MQRSRVRLPSAPLMNWEERFPARESLSGAAASSVGKCTASIVRSSKHRCHPLENDLLRRLDRLAASFIAAIHLFTDRIDSTLDSAAPTAHSEGNKIYLNINWRLPLLGLVYRHIVCLMSPSCRVLQLAKGISRLNHSDNPYTQLRLANRHRRLLSYTPHRRMHRREMAVAASLLKTSSQMSTADGFRLSASWAIA